MATSETITKPIGVAQKIAHDNHYVQQALLRRWSRDGNRIWGYRALVSHAHIPEWELRAIKGLAVQTDLYTVFSGGQEVDTFEHWIQKEFEDPGFEATEKVVTGARLKPTDWLNIQRYVAAQDLRTPLNFIETTQRWRAPSLLNKTLDDAVSEMKRLRAEGVVPVPRLASNPYSESIQIEIQSPTDGASEFGTIQLSMKAGRRLWITNICQLLIQNVDTICRERWTVIEPYGDEEWPLTDHPVVRLNYYGSGSYDFGGGWGWKNSEIMMPIFPRHLLYVKVGSKAHKRFTLSQDYTRQLQRFIAEGAYRWIFTRSKPDWVAEVRPRIIDPVRFNIEQRAWNEWHEVQLNLERM